MLNVNPDIVCSLITRAREFQAKEQVVIPDVPMNPADDWALQILADHVGDLTYQEVKSTVEDLEPDQQAELVALMWLGRGDYDMVEWENALADATEQLTEHTADYLLAHPLVADYLRDGLDQHGYSCEE